MKTTIVYFTPDVVTIPNLDNLQKYCFGASTKPVYFANLKLFIPTIMANEINNTIYVIWITNTGI